MILRFSERLAIDEEDGIAFGAYVGGGGIAREAARGRAGWPGRARDRGRDAPGGGRYAGFGPWPTAGPAGMTAFVAPLTPGPGSLRYFTGSAAHMERVATMGETLPRVSASVASRSMRWQSPDRTAR